MTCKKCRGTGWHKYDHNHSSKCNACCTHSKPRWKLTSCYAGYPGMCCGNGCGHVVRTHLEKAHRWALDQLSNVGLWPWFGLRHAAWSLRNRWRYPYPGTLLARLRRRAGSARIR